VTSRVELVAGDASVPHQVDRGPALLVPTPFPGIGRVLGLMIAAEIGDVARFPHARKLVGYAGLAPRVKQSGERSCSMASLR
jgi:transposase